MNNLQAVQTAVYGLLTATPKTYPVYDAVPQSTTATPIKPPYIVIGNFDAEPDEELAAVTTDAALHLHTWSATAGKPQTHAMLQFIRARLDNVAVSGTWAFTEEFVEIMEDAGSTAAARLYHGIARYRVRVG